MVTFVAKEERKKIFEAGTEFHGRGFNIKRSNGQKIPGYTEKQLATRRAPKGKFDEMMLLINEMTPARFDFWIKYQAYHRFPLTDEQNLRWGELVASKQTVRTQWWQLPM